MTVSPETVEKALELVFGAQSDYASLNAFKSLDEKVLRSAYRRKAMHFHPDRAEVLGLDARALGELFKRLHGAYGLLNRVKVDKSLRVSTAVHRSATRPADTETCGRFYRGGMPTTRLRFVQFLYYSGLIDWQTMISALTWQRTVRPKVGDIGRAYKYFGHSEVLTVIRGTERSELFGIAALRLGIVNRHQLNVMIGKQLSLNYPIGRYFLEEGIFSQSDVDALLARNRRHNCRYNRAPANR
ncbi:MAG: J domain-containing protein [Spirochaetales bacterium]|nr:J domain-containing protein [Spirochaetales bacterium]